MSVCPSTAVVMLAWLASLAFCFYGRAYAEDKSEGRVKCQRGEILEAK